MFLRADFHLLICLVLICIMDCTKGETSLKLENKFTFENGYPSQYLSGSIHYFRVHPSSWRDRLRKLRWAGFHAVQTYVEWSSHEPEPESYDFTKGLDLLEFIRTAEEEGLYVILRPGPYICAERDMGGFPYWLLRLEPNMNLRTSDQRYMKYVRRYFNVLLPMLKPYLYENGGPIIMVQVENEYGNYGCDYDYLTELRNLLEDNLGSNTFLFTTDNGRTNALRCGKIPYVYATVDFGPGVDIKSQFDAQTLINEEEGPSINSEYYVGWIDHWGERHQTKTTESVTSTFNDMLAMNASVNFYVFHGGSSFGFGAGANLGSRFQASPTSYDYDAPISEAGDLTDKYFGIRNVVQKYFPVPSGEPPKSSDKYNYGEFDVVKISSIFAILPSLPFEESNTPKTFEALSVPNGVVVYEAVLTRSIGSPSSLDLGDIHDRGYVFINGKYSGMASREESISTVSISASQNQLVTIAVESQGRIGAGYSIKDFKGLLSTPLINGHSLRNWKMIPIPLYNMTILRKAMRESVEPIQSREETLASEDVSRMSFFEGNIYIPESPSHPMDTFLKLDMFSKGYVWINDFLLGRYWPIVGPQLTTYVPSAILNQGENTILILELERTSSSSPLKISLVDTPDIDAQTPYR